LPKIDPNFLTEMNHEIDGVDVLWPFKRDAETLARPWIKPGTKGLEHRIGGIEKADGTGAISYDPANHDLMTRLRQGKVDGIANDVEPMYLFEGILVKTVFVAISIISNEEFSP
jgi:2-oxoglutarate ferredoxin oxidoreductase subunit alpha